MGSPWRNEHRREKNSERRDLDKCQGSTGERCSAERRGRERRSDLAPWCRRTGKCCCCQTGQPNPGDRCTPGMDIPRGCQHSAPASCWLLAQLLLASSREPRDLPTHHCGTVWGTVQVGNRAFIRTSHASKALNMSMCCFLVNVHPSPKLAH